VGNIFVTILSILGGCSFIGTGIVAVSQRRKVRADAASVLTDSAMKVLTSVEQRAEKLGRQLEATREKLDETQDEMRAMRRHMGVLEDLLRSRGVPIPEFRWPQRNGIA
jgi:uncharacterized membrane protein